MLYHIPFEVIEPSPRYTTEQADALRSLRSIEVEADSETDAAHKIAVLIVALGFDTEPDDTLSITVKEP